MAEKRQQTDAILLRIRGKARIYKLYAAEQWPDQDEADTGLYRVRECWYEGKSLRGRWLCIGGQQYTFMTLEAIFGHLRREAAEGGWLDKLTAPKPDLKKGQWVVWEGPHYGYHTTKLCSDPVLWADGQWRVLIIEYKLGSVLICCDEVTPLDNLRRELPHG